MDNKVLQNAIKTYGEEKQIIVAIEELSELQKELCKCLRGIGNEEAVLEEMADVRVVLKELQIIFQISTQALNNEMTYKVTRLDKRLKNEI